MFLIPPKHRVHSAQWTCRTLSLWKRLCLSTALNWIYFPVVNMRSKQHKELIASKLCAFHSNSLISELTCSCHTAWSLLQIHSCPAIFITELTARSVVLFFLGSKWKTQVVCRYLFNTHFSHLTNDQGKEAGKGETEPVLTQLNNHQAICPHLCIHKSHVSVPCWQ